MSAQHRYVGLDVHKDTITIAVAETGRTGEVRAYGTISSDLHAVEWAVAPRDYEIRTSGLDS